MANLYGSVTGPMHSDGYVDLLDKAIDAIWMRRDEAQSKLKKFFYSVPGVGGGDSFKMSSVSSVVGLPRINQDTEEMVHDSPAPGFDQTFTYLNYRLFIQVTDTMLRQDRFDKIVAMTGGLMKSASRKDENLYAGVINGAFATTTTGDAAYLCSDSHLHERPEAGTYDNLGTGALTGANLQALILLGRLMELENGEPMDVEITDLLVHPNNEQKAMELIKSPLRAEDSLNAVTVRISGLNITSSPLMSSTTAYFCFGNLTGEQKGLLEFTQMDWQLADVGDETVDLPIHKRIKAIKAVGAHYAKNIYGSAGT